MLLRELLDIHRNHYQVASQDSIPNAALLTVSFVIPVFNSATTIADCVRSILAQEWVRLVKEIIIIDDGSTDDSLAQMSKLTESNLPVPILVESNPRRMYSAYSRNRGIQRATGDLVCFIDSDIILPPDYLIYHVTQHAADSQCVTFSLRSNVASAKSVQFPMQKPDGDFRASLLANEATLQDVNFRFSDTHTLAELCLTCAVTYRLKDLLQVQGCPDNFKGWGFNDTAMAAKVIALGRSVVPLYRATVAHLVHAPRSGSGGSKWAEFATNKHRYGLMLELSLEDVSNYHVEALEL